jgi:phosphoglucomutase/phosphomannomutase
MNPFLKDRIESWLKKPFDPETQSKVQNLINAGSKELEDAFYTDLVFGTGGLRGLMGVGTNRMNRYTVRKTTLGLAHYLKKQFSNQKIFTVIGFDSRVHSKEFAKEAALALSLEGIEVYLLKELRPTPYVSFACRHLKAHAAIMITASHNPKEYNGYKVYWQDGAQVVAPHDSGILEEIQKIKTFDLPENPHPSPIHIIDERLDLEYLKAIHPLQLFPKDNQKSGKDLKIIYTSLHGTGITLAPKALADWGFTSVEPVAKQVIPDGTFPTVKLPNPEYKEALELGIDLLTKTKADLLLATDPDADRLGVVVNHQGIPISLNGNETASLCIEYLCKSLQDQGKLSSESAFVSTIVSTDLISSICSFYKVHLCKVLTGFKYIGEKIHKWENPKERLSFIFGAEESYGYLLGTHSRDKDAIVCCCLLAEMALQAKQKGITLFDSLKELYQKYGIFRESQSSIEFSPGKEGMEAMQHLMERLRKNPPKTLVGKKVILLEDYLQEGTGLPKSDVIALTLEDKSKIIIRPSGTEPKVKIYAGVQVPSFQTLEEGLQRADSILKNLLTTVKTELIS